MIFLMGLNRWYSTPKSDAKAIHKLDTLVRKIRLNHKKLNYVSTNI